MANNSVQREYARHTMQPAPSSVQGSTIPPPQKTVSSMRLPVRREQSKAKLNAMYKSIHRRSGSSLQVYDANEDVEVQSIISKSIHNEQVPND